MPSRVRLFVHLVVGCSRARVRWSSSRRSQPPPIKCFAVG